MEEINAITEKGVELSQVIVKSVEDTNTLTPVQKEALDIVFNDVKGAVEHILIDADVPVEVKIMQLISPIMKAVQDVALIKLVLTGADKKAIVLECGRKCIKQMLKEHLDTLVLYDTIAEHALETMLDLSRTLKSAQNTVKEIEKEGPSQDCIMSLFSACVSTKSK